jgi:TRAP-type mannitol/chloroaromatic compound transport system permease small subunit
MIVVIVSRYFFDSGRTDLQELVMYFHSLVFLGCAGYVFNQDGHVRVDIFYREASTKYKNIVDLVCGIIFLVPASAVILYFSIDLVSMSWGIKESSTEPGGLAYVYIQKTFIYLFPITLIGAFLYKASRIIWK